MRRPGFTAITLLAVTILAILTAVSVSNAQTGPNPPPPPPPLGGTPVVGTPTTTGGASFKKLTKKQKTQILNIVKKDRTLKKLLGKKTYRVTSFWVWAGTKGEFLGGVITIQLKKPATIAGTWLELAYDCTEQKSPPYGRIPYLATYSRVTSLTLYVDMKRKRIAGIKPLGVLVGKRLYPPKSRVPSATAC